MIDPSIATQLTEVFGVLEGSIALAYRPSEHPKQTELVAMLDGVAKTSTNIEATEAGEPSPVPWFEVQRDGRPTGISFRGIPGGHEFTSLILSVLYADGKGKRPDDGIIARIQRLQGPVRLRTFVSLSCENCPDVVQALNLMAAVHEDFEHEMVDGSFAAQDVEALGIQGVPAVVHGDTLVSSGKSNLGELLGKLEAELGAESADGETDLGNYDVAVVGGGPAGASSAIYTARKGLRTIVLSDRLGGQLQDTKGIENMISVPYTEGPKVTADLREHLGAYDIDVLEHRTVSGIDPGTSGEPVGIRLQSGETLQTKALIIATGAKWRELGVEGEKEYLGRGVAFCPHCDGPYYKGKDIAVVGGGNSGIEAAIDLAGIVKSVTVLEFMPEPKADAVLLDKLDSLENTHIITNARTTRVVGDGDKVTGLEYQDRDTDEVQTLALAGVFVQIGLIPNSGFAADWVKTNAHGEILVDEKGRTSQPGIYAAGDVTQVPYKQIVVAFGEGAKAGLAAFEDQMVA